MNKNWLFKVKNPVTRCTLAVYDDGRVYLDRTGPLLGNLKPTSLKKIKRWVKEYLPKIKQYGYENIKRDGLIFKFWDYSVKKRPDVAVKGFLYEEDILKVLFDRTKFKNVNEKYGSSILKFIGSDEEETVN